MKWITDGLKIIVFSGIYYLFAAIGAVMTITFGCLMIVGSAATLNWLLDVLSSL